jgi:hypothetical protein
MQRVFSPSRPFSRVEAQDWEYGIRGEQADRSSELSPAVPGCPVFNHFDVKEIKSALKNPVVEIDSRWIWTEDIRQQLTID